MATIVCQNPMTESTTLRLKLSTPKHILQLAIKSGFMEPDKDESGGWSFLTAQNDDVSKEKEVANYVQPLHKRALSSHSLEMCTENLGSETGSDDAVFAASDSESPRSTRKPRGRRESGRRDLPPPLTTMECVRIRRRREEGRMVMEAVKGTSSQTCFRAERSHGRLRLYIDHEKEEQGVEDMQQQIHRRCRKGGESERKGLMMNPSLFTSHIYG